METLLKDGIKYFEYDFKSENDFEISVFKEYQHFFGIESILLSKQKIRTINNIGGIPDGFIINPKLGKWYVLEIELSQHDLYNHIVPQITKFAHAINSIDTKKKLADAFEKEIKEDPYKYAIFLSQGKTDIFKEITKIIEKKPELIIIIEKEHKDISPVMNYLPFNPIVRIVRKFVRENSNLSDCIYLFEPILENRNKDIIIIDPPIPSHKKDNNPVINIENTGSFEIVEKIIMQYDNVIKTAQKSMISYSIDTKSNGKNFVWIQPSKNSLLLYFTNGVYNNKLNKIKVNNRGYTTIRFNNNEIINYIDYIKELIDTAFKIIKKK